jgi:hemolysin activation/secretion protein
LKSDSTNAVVTAPGLLALGKGVSAGFRYRSGLPAFRDAGWYEHSLSFGADRKDVENAVVADEASVVTPITYMPFTLEYSGFVARPQFFTSFRLGPSFNFAGMLPGGSKNDFRNNRGGLVDPISDVTGTFQIFKFGLQHTMRLPGLLQTLGKGRFVAPPEPTGGFGEDWTLQLSSRGQFASQPLISTEQFAAGGTDSVRGYLQGERFGDDGWNLQFELRTPYFERFLGGLLQERAQLLVFYDSAALWTQNPGEGQDPMTMLQGIGLGLRAGIFQHVNAYAYIAYPREKTEFTEGFRYHFGISAGF